MPKVISKVTIEGVTAVPQELSSTYFSVDEEGRIKPITGGGMSDHGNEYHTPDMIPSNPPALCFKITNMYMDDKEKLVIEYEI